MNYKQILIAGLPASGKSTLARKLGDRILEFDSIAEKFGSYEELNEERSLAIRHFQLMAQFGKYDVIVDVFNTRESRRNIVSILPVKPDIVVVLCPVEECLRRNAIRLGSMASNEEIIQMYWNFEPVGACEGFGSIFVYNSLESKLIGGRYEELCR